jgi:hypothetical protein
LLGASAHAVLSIIALEKNRPPRILEGGWVFKFPLKEPVALEKRSGLRQKNWSLGLDSRQPNTEHRKPGGGGELRFQGIKAKSLGSIAEKKLDGPLRTTERIRPLGN